MTRARPVPIEPPTTLQREARALGDPTRHAIFRHLAAASAPVDVAELTELLGLNHNAIRQHLAKLVEAGLVAERTARREGGPGRPRLVYEVGPGADSRWGVTGPYERLSLLLAEVVRTGRSPLEVGRAAGRGVRSERAPGDEDDVVAVVDAMARQGFEPEVRRRGTRTEVVLHACPFASTALDDPDTVCALHLGMAQGVAEGTELVVDELVRKDPRRAGCRLRLHREPPT
jgi:predicted ArsR family transcriptional regulator